MVSIITNVISWLHRNMEDFNRSISVRCVIIDVLSSYNDRLKMPIDERDLFLNHKEDCHGT